MRVQAALLAGHGLVAFARGFDRFLHRLAIADARLVNADVQFEVAQQAVLDHLEVQLSHAADQRLAGLFAFLGAERRVLPLEHLERIGQLLAFGRALGLDCH